MTIAPREWPPGMTQERADAFVEAVLPTPDDRPERRAARSSRAFELTDAGNALRLVDYHGADLRYVASEKRWLLWDDRRWIKDATGAVVLRAKNTVRAIYEEAAAAESADERRELARHATRSESVSRIRAMIELAQPEPPVATLREHFDRDPWLLNVANGTLDLRTCTLRPSRRADLITKLAPVAFNDAAECPRWRAFLARVLADNSHLIDFVQRAIGYSLTGDTREQCLFLLHGPGANGKSTFLELLRALLGEYAAQAGFATFLEKRDDGPKNDVARLAGARVVTSSETGEGRRLNESLVKSLTGSDTVTARFLFCEDFEFRPAFKLWLGANHKPVIRGAGEAMWRRIQLVPFTVTIPEAERDGGLEAALRAELPGILAWAVEGCQRWLEDGLRRPPEVRAATDDYRHESDVLGAFLGECCEIEATATEASTSLYAAFSAWAVRCGENKMSLTKFGTALEERGFGKIENHHGPVRRAGLRLVSGANGGTPGTLGDGLPLYVSRTTHHRGEYTGVSPTVPVPPDERELW